ncbi:hypothetical protein EP47_05795 [Legionella norrlandica]|uniref:DUF4286 domain-containing protein n=1 Tax=Legionella norrlandica TaxID=1498499 RepID=A0A0A2SQV7_9GAMM|nr:DUF4286 family protein [Legionella norrlandica]KGP63495.1 hypothetical protein EP47_05795 [Legionella norrlandica]
MVIYEVSLTIDADVYSQFRLWLSKHVREIIEFPGFIQACILRQEKSEDPEQEKLTVQYQLNSRNDLEKYFSELAPRMREEGINMFPNQFSAERKIFEMQEIIRTHV